MRAERLAALNRWRGETMRADLQPVSHAQRVRLVPEGRRRRWYWAEIEVMPAPDGARKGEPMIVVKRGESVIGWIRPGSRARAEPLFSTVIEHGINVGTVAITLDREFSDTKAMAELVIGDHDYLPAFDF